MTTTAKSQKDRPFSSVPKLTPRSTAASAARAARNASNRNLAIAPSNTTQKLSPSRLSYTNPQSKVKLVSQQRLSLQKSDSKADVKTSKQDDFTKEKNIYLSQQDINTYGDPINILTLDNSLYEPGDNLGRDEHDQDLGSSDINLGLSGGLSEYDSTTTEAVSLPKLNEEEGGDPDNAVFESNEKQGCVDSSLRKTPTPTPAVSRPQTPKYSRPSTPRMPSRPSTPARTHSRHGTPNSRPNTPKMSYSMQSKDSNSVILLLNSKKQSRDSNKNEEGDIRLTFTAKQREFLQMKKELDLKQQAVLAVYKGLQELRDRMSNEGMAEAGEGSQVQELEVFNVADWPLEEVTSLCREAAAADEAAELIRNVVPIDDTMIDVLDAKVVEVPTQFADLCLQAFTARQELIDWMKDAILQNEEGGGESVERIAHFNKQGLELCEALRELKFQADDALRHFAQISKQACRERCALLSVGESLVREIAQLRQKFDKQNALLHEKLGANAHRGTSQEYEEMCRELEEERVTRLSLKDKLATTETQLRQTRLRVTKMDRQLREAEASITSLTATVKTLEDQNRQREVHLEARARKLKESLKTGEIASNQLVQQRNGLQAELQELKELKEKVTSENNVTIKDLNRQIHDFKTALDEQQKLTQKETKLKESLQVTLNQNQKLIEELQNKLTEFEKSKANPELPTEREMELWAELQATKDLLRMAEDEVTTCKREKVRFLETLTKITETDHKIGIQQKLAAELLSKEEILNKMQMQIRELTKNIKMSEQKVMQYEQFVRDLQTHSRNIANSEEDQNGIAFQDMQQEVLNLRMGLLESVQRNEDLTEILMQKDQQLEQQEKTSRAQARVIKVREELINMLKNKETEQSRELTALQQDLEHRMKIVDDVNKQIGAKAEEIQELFSTLENKQQQVHRLEKIVLALEEQQRRAQAQRTRHEEKIAALEHELAAGNKRERKFIFF